MKSIKFLIIALALFSSCQYANAAQRGNNAENNKWLTEVRNYKHNFLVKETEMTAAQRDQFIPLYTEMENEIYKVNREARNLESSVSRNIGNASEADYNRAAEALSDAKAKEGQIENEYYQKFSKILSKKQLFLLKRAETRFARNMLDHNKRANQK